MEQPEETESALGRHAKRVPGRRNSTCKGSEVGISKVRITGGKGGRERGSSEVRELGQGVWVLLIVQVGKRRQEAEKRLAQGHTVN